MSLAVDEYRRQVRQGIFDRMAVTALVSDRVEDDPHWPVAARGTCDSKAYVIQRNPPPCPAPTSFRVPRSSPTIPRRSSPVFDRAIRIRRY